jgi:ferredoxin
MNPPTYSIVKKSVAGRFFVDESCIYCELCVETAPQNFSYDSAGGVAYVAKQPSTKEELDQVVEALEGCPTESIGDRENYKPNYML